MNHPAALMLRASSLAPAARDWVAASHTARFLHVFNRSCNLINDHGRILSLVADDIGNGPFNAVIPGMEYSLPDADSAVELRGGGVWMGGVVVDVRTAPLWDPRPDWAALHASCTHLRERISALSLQEAVARADPPRSRASLPPLWQERSEEALRRAAHDLTSAPAAAVREPPALHPQLDP